MAAAFQQAGEGRSICSCCPPVLLQALLSVVAHMQRGSAEQWSARALWDVLQHVQQATSNKQQGARGTGKGPGARGVQVQRETPRSGAQEHTEERCEGAGRALEQLQQLESDSRVTGAHHSKVSRVRLSEQQHRGGVHQTGVAAPESPVGAQS